MWHTSYLFTTFTRPTPGPSTLILLEIQEIAKNTKVPFQILKFIVKLKRTLTSLEWAPPALKK